MKAELKRFNQTILVREEIFQKQNLTMPIRPPARLLKTPAIQKRGASFSSIKSKMNYKAYSSHQSKNNRTFWKR
jgi:hypothetical protein